MGGEGRSGKSLIADDEISLSGEVYEDSPE